MINYNTPIIDAILLNNGWIRFENTPLYVKKLENQYIISFHLDFKNYHAKYEKWRTESKEWEELPESKVYESLGYPILTSNTVSPTCPTFANLLMLAADAYYHNALNGQQPNFDLHNQYVKKYQIVSGFNYKTGELL